MKIFTMLVLTFTLLLAEHREALIIGNSNYVYISDLDNPIGNLKHLKKGLENLYFNVEMKTDLDALALESSVDNFLNRLSRHRDSLGFLYYTGHGCQVDYQGYLVPTDVNTKDKLKIKYRALNINEMLEKFQSAGNRVNMFFLDACRDVPTGAKGGTKGLGQPSKRPKGSLVVYATEAGQVANDNSKFINALISNISKPNQNIRNMADNISNDVAKRTNYAQIPEVYTKLLPNIVLHRKPVVEPIKPSITSNENVHYSNVPQNSEELKRGKELFFKCAGCHGLDGQTKALGKSNPIGGKPVRWLINAMYEYKTGTRNITGMGMLMRGQIVVISDRDVVSLANYIASLEGR